MLSEKDLREIKEMEEAGLDVVYVGRGGKVEYSTTQISGDEYCNNCSAFRLLPDPDPDDWFRDNDMKAVCTEVNGVIEGSLERPSEWENIRKPLYCPKLGRELTEKEQEIAQLRLKIAKESME